MSQAPGIIVAGTHSGAGKTTAALGLMDLFRRKGGRVQPFKVGPDFIDPSLHSLAAGSISRNLDSFLLSPETVRWLFLRNSLRADLSIVEGVGGLFDGYSGLDGSGSTGEIASILGLPVILVCDARSSARSIAAVVQGFQRFDRKVRVVGVFLNRLANPRHLQWCREAVEKHCRIPVVGWLSASPDLEMKERHIGLIPAAEKKFDVRWTRALRSQMDRQTDWKLIVRSARAARTPRAPQSAPGRRNGRPVRIGIARDAAFSFYYEDGLDLLREEGAELVPFSPLSDPKLPREIDGVYFGGGFPEVYARELEENRGMRASVRRALKSGLPAYAECGGLMYLGRSIAGYDGRRSRMAGVLPYRTEMTRKISMAYLHVRTERGNFLARRGERFRGQVFHFSALRPEGELDYSYRLSDGRRTFPDGIVDRNVLASYLHLHFWSRPSLARNFVAYCRDQGASAFEKS